MIDHVRNPTEKVKIAGHAAWSADRWSYHRTGVYFCCWKRSKNLPGIMQEDNAAPVKGKVKKMPAFRLYYYYLFRAKGELHGV